MLCSFISDLILFEVKCGECLCDVCVNVEKMNKSVVVTLLICRALAMCCAPPGPIPLLRRSSVVSVCVRCV